MTRARGAWIQYLRGSSPQGHMDFPAWGKGSRHGGAQGREGLVPRALGQHLAPDLRRVCLIPDKEATPGTWLANGRFLGNNNKVSADPPAPSSTCARTVCSALAAEPGVSWVHESLWPPTLLWHSMAWHVMAHGTGSVKQPAHGTARADGHGVQGKAGCPILCQPRPDLHQGQQPPGQSCPKGCAGTGPRRGLRDKDGSWHLGPAEQPVPRRFRAVPASCCHSDPVASVGHLEVHPLLPHLALQVAVCP